MTNLITAYTRIDAVTSHDQVEGATGTPVRVVGFTSEGAWTAEPLEGERYLVYDLHTEISTVREEWVHNGYRPVRTPDGEEVWVEALDKTEVTDYETVVTTYAVAEDTKEPR